jgi:hypothetical protein
MKTINKIILFAFALMAFSCEDVLEEDITDDTVQISSPKNDIVIESNVVDFKWIGLQGADKYRVQVYNSDMVVILDSLVKNRTNLTFPLFQGEYKWRVRGENYAYQSTYSFPASFSMLPSEDLTNQHVVLSSPNDNIYANFTNVNFQWQPLANATSYSVEVVNVTNGQQVFLNPSITGTSVVLSSPTPIADGKYEWRVKAKNSGNNTETVQYTARTFFIDRAAPNQPAFAPTSTPADNSTQTVNVPITFTWLSQTDSGTFPTPITYIIQFSQDVNFSTVIQASDAGTATFTQSFSAAGIYYWRIIAKDGALNESVPSVVRKFTI